MENLNIFKGECFMTTQEFVEKYEIGVSFEEMYSIRENAKSKLRFAQSFLGDLKNEKYTKEQENYLGGLKFMLSKYMENKIAPNAVYSSATLEELDLAQFVRDYEDAKRSEFESSGSERKRRTHEHVGPQALDIVLEQLKSFNKNLIDLWAERIKLGVSLDPLREMVKEDGNMEEDSAVVIGYKALEKVINERTWGWRINPLNWKRWYQENKLMTTLTEQLGKFNNVFVEDTVNNYSGPVISQEKIEAFEQFSKTVIERAKAKKTAQNNGAKKEINNSEEPKNEMIQEVQNDTKVVNEEQINNLESKSEQISVNTEENNANKEVSNFIEESSEIKESIKNIK